MMDAVEFCRDRRHIRVSQVANSIKSSILAGKTPKFNDVVLASMARLCIARRTAAEYTDAALFELGLEKKDLELGVKPDVFSPEKEADKELNNILNGKPAVGK